MFTTSSNPRILFISPCWPHGRTFGGRLRALHVARALKLVGDVTLTVVGSDAGEEEGAGLTAAEFEIVDPVPAVLSRNRGAWERLRWALDARYLNVHGFVTSSEDRARIIAAFSEYDLIWIQNARTPNLLQIWHWPHAHLDVDDIPSLFATGMAGAGLTEHIRSRARQMLLRRREKSYRQRFTTLSVCSQPDRSYLGGHGVHVIPNGFPRPTAVPARSVSPDRPRLGFIGLYSHAPNAEGVQWFLRHIWPIVRAAVPGIRFRLVGRDTDGPSAPRAAGVDPLGWMAEPATEIGTWSAMVVPIRQGGGTRIKIADAFSRKCPVVSTRHGAYGYEVRDGMHLRLADSPSEFANACIDLVHNPAHGARMAERAWCEFLEKWTWDAITPLIWSAAEDCLRRSRSAAAFAPTR